MATRTDGFEESILECLTVEDHVALSALLVSSLRYLIRDASSPIYAGGVAHVSSRVLLGPDRSIGEDILGWLKRNADKDRQNKHVAVAYLKYPASNQSSASYPSSSSSRTNG